MKLSDELKTAAAREKLRLHTPGHKGKLCDVDLTELSDGSFPNEHVKNAERSIAKHYGAKNARILCCGSSQGVKAAIYYSTADGIADINSHRSVKDGFALSGKTCSFAGKRGDVRPITLEDIKGALKPNTGAVHITSPTYYGFCADVDGIGEFCKRHGLLFIIDGAHGAHFGASPLLPDMFASKCDICNVSAHKTLNALTQSALLLDNLSGENAAALSDAVDIMGTTSPSYLLMASVDGAVKDLENSARRYADLFEPVCELKSVYPFLKNDDFTRLVLDCSALDVQAETLNAALCRVGVFSEMTDGRHIVFILTAADSPKDIHTLKSAIDNALSEIK